MAKTRLGKKGNHIFQEKDIFDSKPIKEKSLGAKTKQTGKSTKPSAQDNNTPLPWYKKTVRKTYWIDPSVAKRAAVYCSLKGLKESPTVNRFIEEQLNKIGAPTVED